MNYYRKKNQNTSLKNKREWIKITLWLLFVIVVMFFGNDLLTYLIK